MLNTCNLIQHDIFFLSIRYESYQRNPIPSLGTIPGLADWLNSKLLGQFPTNALERYKMEVEVKIYKLALRVCELIREMGVYVGMRFQRRALLKYTQACAAALQFMEEVREVDLPRWRLDTRCSIINQDFGFLLEADNRY